MKAGIVVFDGSGWVLEAVTGQHAHHRCARGHFLSTLQQPSYRGGTGGFTEHPFTRAEQLVGVNDFGIGYGHEIAPTLGFYLESLFPVYRVADADRCGDRVWLVHRMAQHQGGRAGGLKSHHPRQFPAAASCLVFVESHPVGTDVASIANGDAEPIWRFSKGFYNFKGCCLLALEAVWIDRIHQGDWILTGHVLHNCKRPIKVALDGNNLGAIEQGLGQFSLGNVAIWDQHKGPHAAAAGIGGGGGRGVAGAGADHRF